MIYKYWKPIYYEILKDFDFIQINDEKTAELLNKLLDDKQLVTEDILKNLIENNEVLVFGAGPSLESMIDKHQKRIKDCIKIASDGTTSALLKYRILPDVIVTDLDGIIKDQVQASMEGSVVVIHAHGDNSDKIKKYIFNFEKNIIGTTQTNPAPYKNLKNYGGFTDGDRAIFLADHFNAKKITLIGFDFNGEIGEYSFPLNKDKNKKLKKLYWCKKLIDILISDKNKICFL